LWSTRQSHGFHPLFGLSEYAILALVPETDGGNLEDLLSEFPIRKVDLEVEHETHSRFQDFSWHGYEWRLAM
jgi:hypothetical protein